MLHVRSDEVLAEAEFVETISRAVGAGATGVVLAEGAGGGSTTLYEAAVKLRAMLRSRAALLVMDRVDIAQAAEADGVLLTEQGEGSWRRPAACAVRDHCKIHPAACHGVPATGVPTVVAKRMLAATGGGLVGRVVTSANAAVSAAADGANLVLVTVSPAAAA
jgi:hypothetical protein